MVDSEGAMKWIRVIIFWVLIFAGSVGIFEIFLRVVSYTPNFLMFDYTLLFDETRLFRIKPNCAPDINEMGYRGSTFDRENENDIRRVLFLGDSYIMGHNVALDETIVAALSRNLGTGYEVLNMGVMAYGPDQSLLALLEDGLDLNPDMVILGVFAANDFQDLDNNRIFSVDEGGRLAQNHHNVVTERMPRFQTQLMFYRLQAYLQPRIDPQHKFLSRRYEFMMNQIFYDAYDWDLLYFPDSKNSHKKIDLMRAVLMRFKEELNSKKIVFSIVNIPSYLNIVDPSLFEGKGIGSEHREEFEESKENGFFGPEDIVVELCEKLEIHILNLYPKFIELDGEERSELYDEGDWHLSAFGNRFSGNLVATELVRPLLPPPDWEINRLPRVAKPQRPWM